MQLKILCKNLDFDFHSLPESPLFVKKLLCKSYLLKKFFSLVEFFFDKCPFRVIVEFVFFQGLSLLIYLRKILFLTLDKCFTSFISRLFQIFRVEESSWLAETSVTWLEWTRITKIIRKTYLSSKFQAFTPGSWTHPYLISLSIIFTSAQCKPFISMFWFFIFHKNETEFSVFLAIRG